MEDSILNKYLDEIGREQLLTQEEEVRLSARIQKGDERALNRMIEKNLRFVVVIARQYQGQGLLMEDLVSEGNLGLMKAARKFDASRGLRFVNYAVVFIRQQIEKALQKESVEQRVESGKDGQTRSVDAPLGSKANMSLLSVLVIWILHRPTSVYIVQTWKRPLNMQSVHFLNENVMSSMLFMVLDRNIKRCRRLPRR